MTRARGFTLVEILVALAIVAVALTAGMRALAQAADSATALKARTLALWVAQNRLAAAQIATPWPALGQLSRQRHAGRQRASCGAKRSPPRPIPRFAGSRSRVAEPERPDYAGRASRRLHRQFAAAMNGARHATRSAGFTLVEVLLALAIFGVIAVLAYRATAALTDGEARLSAEAQRWRTLEALFTRFEADIRQAVPRGARARRAREPAWLALPADGAGNAALVFTRAGSEFADEPGASPDSASATGCAATVEIAYWPQLDNADDVRPAVYPLADGVAAFRVAYLSRAGAWRDRWPLLGEADLPRAVRVT